MSSRRMSNRGVLWEVVAPVARWPLYSPLRLGALVGVLLVALMLLGRVNGGGGAPLTAAVPSTSPAQPAAATGTPEPEQGSSTSTTPSSSTPEVPTEQVAPPPVTGKAAQSLTAPEAKDVGNRFMRAWVDKGKPADEWRKALRPLVAPSLADQYAGVTPEAVPARRVTGPVQVVSASEEGDVVELRAPTDAGPVRLGVSSDRAGRWVVVTVEPADEPAPSKASSSTAPAAATR